jgi:tetratricopeptide (TPR) repeat protein
MGAIARTEGNYAEAADWYQRSLDIANTGNNRRSIVFALAGLGSAACGLKDYQQAQRYLQEALSMAQRLKNPSAELYALSTAAELLAGTGQAERAVELATLVATHPYTRRDARNHAAQLLAKLECELTAQEFKRACERGKNLDMWSEEAALILLLS